MTSDPDHALKSVVADVLGSAVKSLRRIATGKFNTSFRIQTVDGGDYVIRIAPPDDVPMLFYEDKMILQEPEVHRLVKQHTEIPVANVVHFDNDGALLGKRFIIYTALPGQPWSDHPVSDAASLKTQLGVCIRQLHDSVTGSAFGYIGDHHPTEPQDNWPDAFRVMWRKLIDDIVRIGMYSSDEADRYTALLADHIEHFDRPETASLLHMDIWTQNILTDGQRITGIVDWDRCLWGDPEIEFAVVEYCGLTGQAFWRGYGRCPRPDRGSQIRRAFYLLYEHQKYIFIRHARNGRTDVARRYRDQCRQMLRTLAAGNVEII